MNIKSISIIIFSTVVLASCSIFTGAGCRKYVSDNYVICSSSEASSPNMQLASEKALIEAKRILTKNADAYLVENYSYKKYLSDPEYEKKLEQIRSDILNKSSVICSKNYKKKDKYISSVALQISKSDIDNILKKY